MPRLPGDVIPVTPWGGRRQFHRSSRSQSLLCCNSQERYPGCRRGCCMLRRYLGRAKCRQSLNEQRKIEVDAVAAGNRAALKDIRDNSGNAVARVNATRALELMQQEMDGPKYNSVIQTGSSGPSITIVSERKGCRRRSPDVAVEIKVRSEPPAIDVTPEPPHQRPSTD